MGLWTQLKSGVWSLLQGPSGLLWRMRPYGQPPRRGTPQLMRAYREHPWFRTVTNKIATRVAAVPWRLYQGRGKARVELLEHPFLDLMERPNEIMTRRQAVQFTQLALDLKGDCFWVKNRNAFGRPCELYPVPPHWMIQIPSIGSPFFQGAHNLWQQRIPIEDVLWFRDLDPENPYGRGVGIGESLSDELDTDEYAAKRTKGYFANGAVPDTIITTKGVGAENAKRLKEEWISEHRGPHNAGRPYFTGGEISVTRVDTTLKDMDYIPLRKFERDTIVQTFGVPPEILGIIEHSNRSTIEVAQTIFASEILVPRLDFLQEEFKPLVREFGDDLSYEYDDPVPANQEFALQAITAVPQAFKVNELRDLAGYDPIDGGDVALPAGPVSVSIGGSKSVPDDPPWATPLRSVKP